MTTRRARVASTVAAISAAAVITLVAQTPPVPPPSQQTFRTATDVVIVDASVRDDGRMVAGLGAADFVLTDNGVRQRIENVEATPVPIDVTLVVDVSGNPRRPWMSRVKPAEVWRRLDEEVSKVTALLRAEDRVRLLAIDRYIQQVFPFLPAARVPPVRGVEIDGLAAFHETLAAALLQPVAPGRRHVIIARAKGTDTISAVQAPAVRAIAERSDALFHLVLMETAVNNEDALSAFQCNPMLMGLCWGVNRFWVPHRTRTHAASGTQLMWLADGQAVTAGTRATGGDIHIASGISEPSLTGEFRRAFEDFRASYMLRYTPAGVPRSGWHRIVVTVPKHPGARIRARSGYGVDELVARPPAPPAASPRTVPEVVAAYDRGAYQSVVTFLRQAPDPQRLIRDFEAIGMPWPGAPRKEAAFVLELAEGGLHASRPEAREDAQRLLERYARFIRHPLEPDVFERYWHFAALTMLDAMLSPGVTETFIARALDRFPAEPRFLLARAIAADQRTALAGPRGPGAAAAIQAGFDQARAHYEAVLTLPEVADEARIRLGYLLHRMGQRDAALARLREASAIARVDPALEYLRQLFLGHVLIAMSTAEGAGTPATAGPRTDNEAVSAYRAALALVPTSQAARVSLMHALLQQGDRAGAEALAEQVQAERSTDMDPWWTYWQGQYRYFPLAMARVREMSK